MIERSKTKSKFSTRKRLARVNKQRRLTMEDLEARQLLAADVFLPDVSFPDSNGPRNVGTVQAVQQFESEKLAESGKNDTFSTADFIPLGNGPGQFNTIDLRGSMSFQTQPNSFLIFDVDIDVFAFDLKAGDILDISTLGTAGTIDMFYGNGRSWFSTDQNGLSVTNQALAYPGESPLQTLGNAVAAQVVPEDGRYYLAVSPIDTSSNYTLGLRTYRPLIETTQIGAQQVIYLDFDGAIYPASVFSDFSGVPQTGIIRVPSLQESLPILGLDYNDTAALNRLIDLTVAEVERQFDFIAANGNNGDYNGAGVAGDYGVRILNSRDHGEIPHHPLVTRVLVGGDAATAGQPAGLYGISSTIDIGNFSMDDIVIAVVDQLAADAAGATLSPSASVLDAAADLLALTISHEAGHSFGLLHTLRANNVVTIIDGQVDVDQDLGVGPDGIYGTLDDVNVDFVDDLFDPAEVLQGMNPVLNVMANTLATGTVGGTVRGFVFSDGNGDGSPSGDPGLAGVTVFADVNADGQYNLGEPITVSDASGGYALQARPGTFNVIALPIGDLSPTTATAVSATFIAGSTRNGPNFGFRQVIGGSTGTAFVDSDGDGVRDAGEIGLEGVYVYIDLDGDDRPDLGEPGTNTDKDGNYNLTFPGTGTYTLRSDLSPGFERSYPASGEHLVVFNGISLSDNYHFGFLPSQDFGDAPSSYGTTIAADGARHGITSGLTIGAQVDREGDGIPTSNANGDDTTNLDDEDGVRLLTPLGPGDDATFEVTVTNTTGSNAFLQAFMDFNRDGVFGAGEQFATNIPVAVGTVANKKLVTVSVPAGVDPGETYTRFRLSQTANLGAVGFAATGEVEDHQVTILGAAKVANDDEFTISRNQLSVPLDVLANDFQTADNPLIIEFVDPTGAVGVATNGVDKVFYTPPNGFTGQDRFSYTVIDSNGVRSTASVVVNVAFQSQVPIAVDDTIRVPVGSANRALNVLDNDVASIYGGLTITSVTSGSRGGNLSIEGGGQSLRYTAQPGFAGTEQFIYSIQDAAGSVSRATVTLNLIPGSSNDDVVDFTVDIFDATNNRPVDNVQVGDTILVRVSVEDVRGNVNPEGVASAFLDLLYTDELVTTLDTTGNSFGFDVTFGEMFRGDNSLQRGNALTPGLIDEIGGVQPFGSQQQHSGPVTLFTLKMRAVSPGVAIFQADPADEPISETVVLGSDIALTPAQLGLGYTNLTILPASDNFTSAIDDSYPTGIDSDGNTIEYNPSARNRLDVLANDNLGPTGKIREFFVVTAPKFGSVFIDDNGSPEKEDDFLSYLPNPGTNGLESFIYTIITDDNVRSSAEVTMSLGNQRDNAQVSYDLTLVSGDGTGTEINSVAYGDRFGVQIHVEDIRAGNSTFVFAGYLDLLYSSDIIQPADTNITDRFDFDVEFGTQYLTGAGVGTAARNGIIDEFGSVFDLAQTSPQNPGLLATIYFDAVGLGYANLTGSPADYSPFQDTLVFGLDDPIESSRLRFDSLNFMVGTSGPMQNPGQPEDVNNDGAVSPIDALVVINQMYRTGNSAEGESAGNQFTSLYFTDVNGDERTSAADALRVINFLQRQYQARDGGEQVLADISSSTSSFNLDSADNVFTALGGDGSDPLASFDSIDDPMTGAQMAYVGSLDADDDDDSDSSEVVSLLADDVASLDS